MSRVPVGIVPIQCSLMPHRPQPPKAHLRSNLHQKSGPSLVMMTLAPHLGPQALNRQRKWDQEFLIPPFQRRSILRSQLIRPSSRLLERQAYPENPVKRSRRRSSHGQDQSCLASLDSVLRSSAEDPLRRRIVHTVRSTGQPRWMWSSRTSQPPSQMPIRCQRSVLTFRRGSPDVLKNLLRRASLVL
jgi:hypothetical protein